MRGLSAAGGRGCRLTGFGPAPAPGGFLLRRTVMATAKPQPMKIVATNRKAGHDFLIHERIEAGVVLVGSEVKSLRDAKVVISDGWAEIKKHEAWLHGVQINEYPWANRWNHEV